MASVLLADKLHASVAPALSELGCEVIEQPQLDASQLPSAIDGIDILVVRSTQVTQATIAAANRLSLIIRAGAGVNTIDVEAASNQGIHVVNCPGVNAAAVAELTAGLLIAADRQIANACSDLRNGLWKKKIYSDSHGLKGRTLGILGMGSIGQAVAKIAHGLDMDVVAWSRSLTPEIADRMGVRFAESPTAVAEQADAVSVHLALTDDTRHLVGKSFLNSMRDGSILVNTSRGPLVDTAALKDAIEKKKLRVALDVYEEEPDGGDGEFAEKQFAQIITGTPHIGASTAQTSEAIGAAVVEHIKTYTGEGRVNSSVNMGHRAAPTHRLVVRHLNRVGVLASVLSGLRKEQINVEDMQNQIFDSAAAAICTLQLSAAPSAALIDALNGDESILQITQYKI